MKIYTVTYLSSNYGSTLQAYALQSRLNEYGATPIVLLEKKEPVRHRRLYTLINLLKPKKHYSFWQRIRILLDKKKYLQKETKMNSFIRQNLTVMHIQDRQSFLETVKNTDIFLAGSDQIWNTLYNPLSDWFTFKWVKSGNKKYSYAVSVGKINLTFEEKQTYKESLADFQQISLREVQAVNELGPVFKDKIRQDLDPTLLYDGNYWRKFASQRLINEPYIFVYMLRPDRGVIELARRVAKEKNCKIVYTGLSAEKMKNITTITDAGVGEFLSYILYADAIVTNSFHGTVFSILYEKPFLSVSVASTSSRVESLLGQLGLKAQFVKDTNDRYSLDVDYTDALNRLDLLRKKSIEYLRTICES